MVSEEQKKTFKPSTGGSDGITQQRNNAANIIIFFVRILKTILLIS
jgi:hypothetical protein